jgi:hypothetical protein
MAETFNRTGVKLSTTDVTDAYQAPNVADADRAVVLSIMVANVDASDSADITVSITDASNTEVTKIANTIQVPSKASLEVVANKVVLKRGEKIRATASAANRLDVTVSALEIS